MELVVLVVVIYQEVQHQDRVEQGRRVWL